MGIGSSRRTRRDRRTTVFADPGRGDRAASAGPEGGRSLIPHAPPVPRLPRALYRLPETRGIPPTPEHLTAANVRAPVVHHLEQGPPRRGATRTRQGKAAARAYIDLMKRLGSWLEEEDLIDVSPLRKLRRRRLARHLREP